jgi:hypothetical protein
MCGLMGGGDFPVRLYGDTIQALLGGLMGKFIDRTKQVFGKLTVVEQAGRDRLKKVLWRCKCECGNETVIVSGSLVTGNTTSCGCVTPNLKHGGSGKGSYNTWRAMIRRCTIPTDKDYPRYGGKGVTVCLAWMKYEQFAKDMGEPQGDETLDRINVYGNYDPSNCRWAGVQTQNRNTRLRVNSTTGYIGVSVVGKRFLAKITVGKKSYYSKLCDTVEEAAAARKELETRYWL